MKFWTIQSRSVYQTINREGFYQPDFSESPYLAANPSMRELYDFVHAAFARNNVNLTMTPPDGLVFCFAQTSPGSQSPILQIEDIQQFTGLMNEGIEKNTITSLLQHYAQGDHVVMELNVGFYFNPLPIEINNFQALMPPILELPPYTAKVLEDIQKGIWEGRYIPSPMPSGLIQLHLPAIIRDMVTSVYPFS